jgi:hypothetical protein
MDRRTLFTLWLVVSKVWHNSRVDGLASVFFIDFYQKFRVI